MDLGLTGKRALVTGGASGMGAALVKTLAAEGAQVCVNYRSRSDEAQQIIDEINQAGGRAVAVQADLAHQDQARRLFDESVDLLGGLDILVNNAGLWLTCEIGEITEEQWDVSLAVNLKSPMMLSQWFVKHCVTNGHTGRILNVTSQAAFRGSSTGHLPYAVSKGGMVTMVRSMATEMKDNGVTVNGLAIGTMDSPMIAAALEQRREFYERRIPVGYLASPQQVADIAAFLVSERSNYMTGATVDVSGGQLLH